MRLTLMTLLLAGTAAMPARGQGKIELSVPLTELQQRVKADSNDPAAHYNVALGYWAAKKWPEVDRELREAVKLDPRFAPAHLALAFLPLARNPHLYDNLDASAKELPKEVLAAENQRVREYRHAFLIDPMVDLRIIAANASTIDYGSLRDALDEATADYIHGIADCQEGKYADCENNFAAYMMAYGRSKHTRIDIPASAYWYHGIAEAHLQRYDLAIADFQTLIDRDSVAVRKAEEKTLIHFPIRTNEYRYFIGVFQQAAGHTADAIATYRAALERDLSLYIAHVRLAEIYEAQKDFANAIQERRNAVNANPDDASLQIDLGITLGRAGMFADAEQALTAATDALPRSTEAWFWRGIAEQQLGKKDEAKKAFEQVIAVAPARLQARVASAKQHLAALQ